MDVYARVCKEQQNASNSGMEESEEEEGEREEWLLLRCRSLSC